MKHAPLGSIIYDLRKKKGLTQSDLASAIGVSYQAISKWETNVSIPDTMLLPAIADVLECSIDVLLGHSLENKVMNDYEKRYQSEDYYWGYKPSRMVYEVMKCMPADRPLRLLDVGCGEGKDAVFFARNGYIVTAIDISEAGLQKGRRLAAGCGVSVNFVRSDILDLRLETNFDIIFCSGVLQYVPKELRETIINDYKAHTNDGGFHAMNVFVEKPFIPLARDYEKGEKNWKSGELMTCYHDWMIHDCEETIFDCMSGGVPHKHCMDIVYAYKNYNGT